MTYALLFGGVLGKSRHCPHLRDFLDSVCLLLTSCGMKYTSPPLYAGLVCPDPGKPAHGGHTISSSHVGGEVAYYCDGSYQLVGDERRVCGQGQAGEGAWNGSVPTCERECFVAIVLWASNTSGMKKA